ncbi:MAG: hypothetical protein JXR07_11455 [Reichenbachiella sp.]
MKKSYNNIFKAGLLVSLLAIAFSCQEDYIGPTGSPSSIYLTTGFGDNNPMVQINGSENFADLSSGVVSREWSFPGGEITDISSSTEPNVTVTFSQVGEYDINLTHTFEDFPWNWEDSVQMDSKTLDSTFVVTVVDSVRTDLQAFYVKLDGTDSIEMTMGNGAKNQLMVGELVRFKHVSTGAANTFKWSTPSGSPESVIINDPDSIVDVKYNDLGVFDVNFEASRPKPEGERILNYSEYLEVIPSSRPIILDRITAENSTTIALEYSRAMSVPTDEAANFEVRVKNKVIDNIGIPRDFDEIFTVTNVTLGGEGEKHKVLLELDERLYNSDEVLVSYTPGNLQSIDAKPAAAFDETSLTWIVINIAELYGEMESIDDWILGSSEFPIWGNTAEHNPAEITNEQARSGNSSLKLQGFGTGEPSTKVWSEIRTKANHNESADYNHDRDHRFFAADGDKFRLTYWMYHDGYTLPDDLGEGVDNWLGFSPYFYPFLTKVGTWDIRIPGTGPAAQTEPWWRDKEWVKREAEITIFGDQYLSFYVRITGEHTVFIDDVIIERLEVRPFPE